MRKFLLLTCMFCGGCAVYMAANKKGTDIVAMQRCTTRLQFLNLGAAVLSSERMPDGSLQEIYQVPKEKGSAARAILHGFLDLSSGFAWEIIGAPMELCLDKDEFITIKVTYDKNDSIQKAEII